MCARGRSVGRDVEGRSVARGRVYLHRCAVRSKKRDAVRGCRPKSQEGGDPRLLNSTAARWRGGGLVCDWLCLLWSDGVRLPLRGVWEQMWNTPGSRTHPGLGSRAPLGRRGREDTTRGSKQPRVVAPASGHPPKSGEHAGAEYRASGTQVKRKRRDYLDSESVATRQCGVSASPTLARAGGLGSCC